MRYTLKQALAEGLIERPSLPIMMLLDHMVRNRLGKVYVLPKDFCGTSSDKNYLIVEVDTNVFDIEPFKYPEIDILVRDGIWSWREDQYSDQFVQQWVRFTERRCGSGSILAPATQVSLGPSSRRMSWHLYQGVGRSSHVPADDPLRAFKWYVDQGPESRYAYGSMQKPAGHGVLNFERPGHLESAFEIEWDGGWMRGDNVASAEEAVRRAVDSARESKWKPAHWTNDQSVRNNPSQLTTRVQRYDSKLHHNIDVQVRVDDVEVGVVHFVTPRSSSYKNCAWSVRVLSNDLNVTFWYSRDGRDAAMRKLGVAGGMMFEAAEKAAFG